MDSLKTSLFIKTMADSMMAANYAKDFIGRTRGPIKGFITDVLDPLNEGRVKVVIDSKNGETQYQSDWLPVQEPFMGQLPESLIGARVNINPTDSDMHRMVVTSVINDEKSKEIPKNTTMTRMPIYPSNKLPPPCKENLGCSVIEEKGPYGWDTLCVCLSKEVNGEKTYYWIRLQHFDHIHAGADDSPKYQEFLEGSTLPGEWSEQKVVWDRTLPTSDVEYPRSVNTNYGDNGRGTIAEWQGPAGMGVTPKSFSNFDLSYEPPPNTGGTPDTDTDITDPLVDTHLVLVSDTDTTENFLGDKLNSDNGVTFITQNEGNNESISLVVNHNQISNYSVNEHIDHGLVNIIAGNGLSGGGSITTNRTLELDLNSLPNKGSIFNGDYITIVDTQDGNTNKKVLFSNLDIGQDTKKLLVSSNDTLENFLENKLNSANGVTFITQNEGNNESISLVVNHDQISNYSVNEHIDHGLVNIIAGNGLSGGGSITTNRTLKLDLNSLPNKGSIFNGDYITIVDTQDGNKNKKVLFSDLGVEQDTKELLVSSNDTTEGFLEDKIVAGDNVEINVNDEGLNETLSISFNNNLTANTEDMSSDKTLVNTDKYLQILNPNGSNRDVVLNGKQSGEIVNNSSGVFALNIKETSMGPIVLTLSSTSTYKSFFYCKQSDNSYYIRVHPSKY